jgi:hypothetical protein
MSWTSHVRNAEVLHKVCEEWNILHTIKRKEGRLDWSHLAQELPSITRY